MFVRETGQQRAPRVGGAEDGQHFGLRVLLMVGGPLIGLAYIILLPLIGSVGVLLLGIYQLGRMLRAS